MSGVVGAEAALLGRRWRAEVFGHYWTPSETDSPNNAQVGVRVQGWEFGARGCGVVGLRRVEFPLCAGVAAGALRGVGQGQLSVATARSPWMRALAGPAVRVDVWNRRLWVGARVEGFALLARGTFVTEPSGEVFAPRAGGVVGTAAVEIRFP